MSSARTKKYNRNRYRKTYQPVRALPVWGIHSDKEIVLETLRVSFKGLDEITFTLNGRYSSLPGIVVTPIGSTADLGDVNIFISSLTLGSVPSGGGKSVSVVLGASTHFEGDVFVQALMI